MRTLWNDYESMNHTSSTSLLDFFDADALVEVKHGGVLYAQPD